jgi:hypothetical protein
MPAKKKYRICKATIHGVCTNYGRKSFALYLTGLKTVNVLFFIAEEDSPCCGCPLRALLFVS